MAMAMAMAKYHLVIYKEGRRSYDRMDMVAGCAIIYEISAYDQYSWEFESVIARCN